MALTYTGQRNLFGNLANNSSTANLALADTLMNEMRRRILSSRQWPFLERQYTTTTDAANQFVSFPSYVDRVSSVYVTIGNIRYTPNECTSREFWDTLNIVVISSNIPQWWYTFDGKVGLYPAPSTTGNTITINSKRQIKDLTIADYTTGTITTTSTTSGVTTVTGSGTAWTSQMIGKFIQITEAGSNTGDGFWYEIATVPSSTTLTLVRPYGGTAITAGSANYIIGQLGLLPEPYQILPVYMALNVYFTSVDPDANKAQLYDGLAKDAYTQLVEDYGSKTTGVVVDFDGASHNIINPNLTVTL
jgi:hypothetical protein